ncbi:Crossover junction endodeoxyribonuclease RuvC [subsurface metagenome]
MIVLGVDPGTAATGYGLINTGKNPEMIECDCIYTSSQMEMADRLKIIYQKMGEIIHRFHPKEVAIEQIYFSKNSKTALSIGQARGVIMLAASNEGIRVFNYSPLEVKQTITGYGRATKHQIQHMVKDLLHLSCVPRSTDSADALAVALCHYYSRRLRQY